MNAEAAETAQRAAAYAAAVTHAQLAIHLLGADGWQTHYPLMLRLHLLAAEAAFLNADNDLSEEPIETILTSARSTLDKASAYAIQILSYNTQNKQAAAIEAGLSVLRELGVPLSAGPPPVFTLEDFCDLPVMSDRRTLAAIEVLAALLAPVYATRPDLYLVIILTILDLTKTHGLTPAACYAIVIYAIAIVWHNDIEAACHFGRLGRQLIARFDDRRYLYQVKTTFDMFLLQWEEHFSKVKSAMLQNIRTLLEAGSRAFVSACLNNDTFLNVLVGNPLAHAQEAMEQNMRQLARVREQYRERDGPLWIQCVAHLRGLVEEPTQFAGPYFDEVVDLPAVKANHLHNTLRHYYILKTLLCYHLDDYHAAYAHAKQAELKAPLIGSDIYLHLLPFYQSLTLLQLPQALSEHGEKLDENVGNLRLWAKHAPMNYQHKLDIVLAERERVAGNVGAALGYYEQAIAGARQNGYLQDEALANELYGRFWLERGNDKFAQLQLREAHALYLRWGAGAITAHLEEQYSQWLNTDVIEIGGSTLEPNIIETHGSLVIHSVLRTAEVIAGELSLEKLLQTLMSILIQNAGAQRAYLITERDGQWLIEAEGDVNASEPRVLQHIGVEDNDQVPSAIVHYVAHTRQMVLLTDAASAGQFRQDPSIRRRQVKSVLSMPLINRGQLSGILYLENNLASHVFTSERVKLLKLLSSQMAISIDQARLYEQLEEKVAERTRALGFAEEQIRTLFENSPLGIGLTTLEGKILATNNTLLQMTGFAEAEVLHRCVTNFYVNPEQRADLLERLSTSNSVNIYGVKFKRKNGSYFLANMHVSKVKREEQQVILAMIEDVTEQVQLTKQLQQEIAERKLAEEEYQSQIALVDSLLDVALDTIEIFDANDLSYIKWNRTFNELTGYSDEEIIKMNPAEDFFDEADLPKVNAAVEEALISGMVTEVATLLTKDGSRVPMEYTGSVTKDPAGNPLYFIAIGRDITERVQAEEQLRFQATLLKAVQEAIIVTSLVDGTIVYWNPIAEQLFGWTAEEAIGRTTVELVLAADEQMQERYAEIAATLIAGKGWSGEYLARRRDGTLIPLRSNVSPVFNPAGGPIYAISIVVDITERKQAELALQQTNHSLNQRLEELSTLNLIAQTVSTVVDLADALDIVVASITRLFDAETTAVFLLSDSRDSRSDLTLFSFFDSRFPLFSVGGNSEGEVVPPGSGQKGMVIPIEDGPLIQTLWEDGQSVVNSDAQPDPPLTPFLDILSPNQARSLLLVPLLSQGNPIGVMSIAAKQTGREFTPDERRLAETVAAQITAALETARRFEQTQKIATMEERNRLARELHDSVTQSLYGLDLFANAIDQALSAGRIERVSEHAEQIRELSQSALADLRLLIFELRPPLLEEAGLAGALQSRLESVEGRVGVATELEVAAEKSLSANIEAELYAVSMEALNNVLKHAQADQVTVILDYDQQRCRLTIRDNGLGFDLEAAQTGGGFGLRMMVERVERIGGTMTLDTSPGKGTIVTVEVTV